MQHHNLPMLTDSYKVTHYKQYPPGTTEVSSYFESRGGKFEQTVFFGLQYFLMAYLNQPVTLQDVEEAKRFSAVHFGSPWVFNEAGWKHILAKHGGKLPVRIKAVPEGTRVPTSNVLMTVENTDPECYWLTNYLETLLVQTWYPMTVATLSNELRRKILGYLEDTGTPSLIDFKLHDFGFRGSTSPESAGIGGMAHLLNFMGSDTIHGINFANLFYRAEMAGFSIPAAEHSTITSWGQDNEADAFENMLDQYPEGLVAVVSDSYDIFNACSNIWGGKLKDKIMNRNGTLVIRPDSGDPNDVLPRILEALHENFGAPKNAKGYKMLNEKVRIIQGDGCNYESIESILFTLKCRGWSIDNIGFGMGGGLLQQLDRDTQMCAFKCSNVVVDGQERMVHKQPVTDLQKRSKPGRLALINTPNGYVTNTGDMQTSGDDCLVTVFEDGEVKKQYEWDDVKARAQE